MSKNISPGMSSNFWWWQFILLVPWFVNQIKQLQENYRPWSPGWGGPQIAILHCCIDVPSSWSCLPTICLSASTITSRSSILLQWVSPVDLPEPSVTGCAYVGDLVRSRKPTGKANKLIWAMSIGPHIGGSFAQCTSRGRGSAPTCVVALNSAVVAPKCSSAIFTV